MWMVTQNLDGEQKVVEAGVKSKIISYLHTMCVYISHENVELTNYTLGCIITLGT